MAIARLDRTVIRLSGDGVKEWLDKLVTNNLDAPLTFTALLTPQGKIIADFFIASDGHDLLIDTATKFADGLLKRLKMYRLRAPIHIDVEEALSVYALWNGEGEEGHLDPRHGSLGYRLITDSDLDSTDDYNTHRLSLGVTDSQWDFETAQVFPADVNMDLMNGVDFKKGCFVGQEIVARMKHKTELKKGLARIAVDGSVAAGDAITVDGKPVGTVHTVAGDQALAYLRFDRAQSEMQTAHATLRKIG